MIFVAALPQCFHGVIKLGERNARVDRLNGWKVPKLKLTKWTVDSLKVNAKDYITFDAELPGFGCASCRAESASSLSSIVGMGGRGES